jgi:deoxyadenosine/deoxycytidine kinase
MVESKLITVEGNIACGKSTLLNSLDRSAVEILTEPVEKWKNWKGKNMLELMYNDPKKYMFDFQIMARETLADNHNYITEKHLKVMERSLYSGIYIFTEMAYYDSNLTHNEYINLKSRYEDFIFQEPDFIIYLRTDPKLCFQRMNERNRGEEGAVSLNYFQNLHKYHEDVFIENQSKLPCPVIILNGDDSKDNIKKKTSKLLNLI